MQLGSPAKTLTLTCPISEEFLLLQIPAQSLEGKWKKLTFQEAPRVWAENNPPGLAKHVTPVIVRLTSGVRPIPVKPYTIISEPREVVKIHIRCLLETGTLIPCQLSWNTSLFPVQKPGTQDYRPGQDLREVNKRVESTYTTVPNPYSLLS